MLYGDWPTKDFIDIGRPLTILVSAMGQRWIEHTLFAEALVVSAGFGVAAALTSALVYRLTGSTFIAVAAAAVEDPAGRR